MKCRVMKNLVLLLSLALLLVHVSAQRRTPGTCDPYADKCAACSDCSRCHWCHDKGGTCSVCLEAGRKKAMARLLPVQADP